MPLSSSSGLVLARLLRPYVCSDLRLKVAGDKGLHFLPVATSALGASASLQLRFTLLTVSLSLLPPLASAPTRCGTQKLPTPYLRLDHPHSSRHSFLFPQQRWSLLPPPLKRSVPLANGLSFETDPPLSQFQRPPPLVRRRVVSRIRERDRHHQLVRLPPSFPALWERKFAQADLAIAGGCG